jgi:hypothetical protein
MDWRRNWRVAERVRQTDRNEDVGACSCARRFGFRFHVAATLVQEKRREPENSRTRKPSVDRIRENAPNRWRVSFWPGPKVNNQNLVLEAGSGGEILPAASRPDTDRHGSHRELPLVPGSADESEARSAAAEARQSGTRLLVSSLAEERFSQIWVPSRNRKICGSC